MSEFCDLVASKANCETLFCEVLLKRIKSVSGKQTCRAVELQHRLEQAMQRIAAQVRKLPPPLDGATLVLMYEELDSVIGRFESCNAILLHTSRSMVVHGGKNNPDRFLGT